MDPRWAELREFIRRLRVSEDRIGALERKAQGLRTGVRDLWSYGGSGGAGFRVSTIAVAIKGGRLTFDGVFTTVCAPAGVQVAITDHDDGTFYGHASANSGDAFATLQVVTDRPTINVDPVITTNPSTLRLHTFGTPLTNLHLTMGGTAILFPTSDAHDYYPTAGYRYTGLVDLPVAETLKIDDTSHGVTGATLPFSGPGFGNYGSAWQATVGSVTYTYRAASLSSFPLTFTISSINTNYTLADITSVTFPDDSGTKFSVSFAVAGGTVTIYEP